MIYRLLAFLYVLCVLFVVLVLTGCSTKANYQQDGSYSIDTSNNFYGKAVSAESSVYGVEASASTVQTPTPAIRLGLVQGSLDTFPIKKGQPFKVTRKKGSIWNSNAITETVIEIGVAPYDGTIKVNQLDDYIDVTLDTGRN